MTIEKIRKSKSRFYTIWVSMKNRGTGSHENYRNVKVSKEWQKFDNFFNDMHDSYCEHTAEYGEKDTTIERTNNNGNYCKENCIWATFLVQANNRSNNRYLTLNGRTQTVSQWAREVGISRQGLSKRLEMGWSLDKALQLPKYSLRKAKKEKLLKDVRMGKFGTKNRVELILRLTDC